MCHLLNWTRWFQTSLTFFRKCQKISNEQETKFAYLDSLEIYPLLIPLPALKRWYVFRQVSLVVLFMVGVIVYKLLVIHPLYENPNFQEYASTIVSVTGSIMNLIIIMILSKVRKTGKWVFLIIQPFYEMRFIYFFMWSGYLKDVFLASFVHSKRLGTTQ